MIKDELLQSKVTPSVIKYKLSKLPLAISQNCHDLLVNYEGKVKYGDQEPFDVKDEELIPIVMKINIIADKKALKILEIH